jgi:hypothetical protein
METNNAPFYVGQRVVCVNGEPSYLYKGVEYVIRELRKGCCESEVWVGTSWAGRGQICGRCLKFDSRGDGKCWYRASRFAPIQPAYESATEEILSKFQPTDEKPDKVLKPEKANI